MYGTDRSVEKMAAKERGSCLSRLSTYVKDDIGQLPARLKHRTFLTKSKGQMEASAMAQSKNQLKKVCDKRNLVYRATDLRVGPLKYLCLLTTGARPMAPHCNMSGSNYRSRHLCLDREGC